MSKTNRLLMRNDGCEQDYIRHFGVVPTDESRQKVLQKLSSFLLDDSGEPIIDLTTTTYVISGVGPKELKHPAIIGFDLAINAAGRIIRGGNSDESRPYGFGFTDIATIRSTKYGEKLHESRVERALYSGFTYGLNILSKTLPYSRYNGGLNPDYRFQGLEPVAVSDDGSNVMLVQPISHKNRIYPETGVRQEFERFPSGYAGAVPTNIDRMIQFAVLPRLVAEIHLAQVGSNGALLDSRNFQK